MLLACNATVSCYKYDIMSQSLFLCDAHYGFINHSSLTETKYELAHNSISHQIINTQSSAATVYKYL